MAELSLGVISDEISQDLDRALAVCAELEIHQVELRDVGHESLVRQDETALDRVRRAFAAGGFSCPCISSPFLKSPPDQVDWDLLHRSIEAAQALGATMVRTFGFLRTEEPLKVPGFDLVEVLEEAIEETMAAGLTLVLENEHACAIATGTDARPVLDRLGGPGFGLIWDPGNAARAGECPFPDGYEAVRGHVRHVHLKDFAGGEWVRIGAGEIDYHRQLQALAADGYQGCLSVETHYSLAQGGREAATRECVAALGAIAAEAGVVLA